MFFVYMLRSVKQPEVIQIASTDSLDKIVTDAASIKNSIAGWLAPWELLLTESYNTISEALLREKYLKSSTYNYELPDYLDY